MKNNSEVKLLRIFIGSTDKFKHTPLYEVIVYAAKRYGLAGATVTKGIMGFGASSIIHAEKLWEISEKLPLIVEIVDDSVKIDKFVKTITPYFEKIKYGCVITVEKINLIYYKAGNNNQLIIK